jgi:hypothetical protein
VQFRGRETAFGRPRIGLPPKPAKRSRLILGGREGKAPSPPRSASVKRFCRVKGSASPWSSPVPARFAARAAASGPALDPSQAKGLGSQGQRTEDMYACTVLGMLVDVVQMRSRGERRPEAEVRGAAPVRGILQLDPVRPGWHRGQRNAPLLAGLLVPGVAEWALPPLDQARIKRIRGPYIYIVGLEEIESGRHVKTYPQGWWCRLVLGQVFTAPGPASQPDEPRWLTARANA